MKTITRRAFARVRDKGKPQLFAKFAIGSPIRLVLSEVWRQKSNWAHQQKHRGHGGSAVNWSTLRNSCEVLWQTRANIWKTVANLYLVVYLMVASSGRACFFIYLVDLFLKSLSPEMQNQNKWKQSRGERLRASAIKENPNYSRNLQSVLQSD